MQKSIRSFIVFFNVLYIQQLFVLADASVSNYREPLNTIQQPVDKQSYTPIPENPSPIGAPRDENAYARPQAPPEKRVINFYTKKTNIGYLYNVGTNKFLGTDSNKYWLFAVDKNPLLIAIVTSYGQSIGTYQEIIPVDDAENPKLGSQNSSDLYAGVKRIDTGGGSNQNRCYLYGATSTYNRFVISPPYYKNSTAFKIQRLGYCLGIDASMNLMQMNCVEDTTDGHGTPENDMQLFKFCRTDSPEKCKDMVSDHL
ncbi:hypothetical protein NEMIN01_0542 [Nematocida minor]|uniref:uncharacterized protein n=1 Tax=Nematocida minor TaxID=1912983 RepID=UPI00221FFC18|nr:uncharacterized protein NEMIN01_0542 [Nematocida minor]KAI5189479.1 hypothetical protein NEMIN01_0542 [Nematocida minor]